MNTDDTLNSVLNGVICEKPFYDAVYMDAPTGIALTDCTGKFLDVNEACAHILGYSRAELIGRSFQEITHSEDILYDMQMFNELLRGRNETYEMAKRFITKTGMAVWVRVRVNSVREDGRTTHLVKHIVQMEPVQNGSNALVNDILGDRLVRRYVKISFGLLIFCSLASILTLLHVLGLLFAH